MRSLFSLQDGVWPTLTPAFEASIFLSIPGNGELLPFPDHAVHFPAQSLPALSPSRFSWAKAY